jgi:acyl dehydratase
VPRSLVVPAERGLYHIMLASSLTTMPPLYFEDFSIGDRYEPPARTVAEADVIAFAGLSGDANPLHSDEAFAAQTVFRERIAHGLLGLAIAGGLLSRAGVIDGTAVALLGVQWNFRAPVRFGDTLAGHIRVAETRPTSDGANGLVRFDFELTNQHDVLVQSGQQVFMVRRRPHRIDRDDDGE